MRYESRILVADDDPTVLLLFTTLLVNEGYDVREATTGQECLDAVQSHHPDIVLLDVMLPDMKGVEVCRQIKTEPGLQGILVILVSGARVSSESQAEGLDIGADGYIIKGLSNREFLARIQSLVRIKRAEDALRAREKEQRKLISELEKALAEIRTLKGLIPICASCKKIRDDEGFWNQLEVYIGKHTDAVFSHGICPECAEELYPEYCGKANAK
jgi:DNA-binding response OmpR family regulator